jgi:hypothetical protein
MDSIPLSKDWIKKEDPTICFLKDTHTIDTKVKGWKKIYQANGPLK